MKEEARICDLCHKGKAVICCFRCKKWLCRGCLTGIGEKRKCCGREGEENES